TFLRNTQPRSRGAFFCAKCGNGQTYVQAAIWRECNAAHKAPLVSALKFAAAHNDATLASGGGHGTQSNEVRTRLLDGPCDGGDHPGDQTVGGPARFAEQVSIAHRARDITYQPQHWKVF